jgi:hypothetical protein
MVVLREGDGDLTVPSPNVEDRGALIVEKFKERLLLHLKHPLTNGIPETGGVFIRGRVKVSVLGVS